MAGSIELKRSASGPSGSNTESLASVRTRSPWLSITISPGPFLTGEIVMDEVQKQLALAVSCATHDMGVLETHFVWDWIGTLASNIPASGVSPK